MKYAKRSQKAARATPWCKDLNTRVPRVSLQCESKVLCCLNTLLKWLCLKTTLPLNQVSSLWPPLFEGEVSALSFTCAPQLFPVCLITLCKCSVGVSPLLCRLIAAPCCGSSASLLISQLHVAPYLTVISNKAHDDLYKRVTQHLPCDSAESGVSFLSI